MSRWTHGGACSRQLSRLAAVQAPAPQTAAAREEGRLRVCGFHLVAEATRERRLDHRSSWSRTLRLAVLVGFITLALVVHAAVVALHAVLVVEIGMLRKCQRQLRRSRRRHCRRLLKATTSSCVVGSKPMAPTPAPERIATPVRPMLVGRSVRTKRGSAPKPVRGIYYGNDRRGGRQAATSYPTRPIPSSPPTNRCRRGRSGSGYGRKRASAELRRTKGPRRSGARQAGFVYWVTNSAHRSMRPRRFPNRSDRA